MLTGRSLSAAAALLLLITLPVIPSAQELAVPGQILNFPTSLRSLGMGVTGTSDMSDPANSHYNPALLMTADGLYLGGSMGDVLQDFDSDASILDVGLICPIRSYSSGPNRFVLSGEIRFGRFDYGELEELTTGDELITYHPTEQNIRLTVAGGIVFSERYHIGLGLSVKQLWSSGLEWENSDDLNYRKLAADMGLMLAWDTYEEKGYLIRTSMGFSLLDIGTDIDIDGTNHRLPKKARFGMGLVMEFPGLESWNEWSGIETPFIALSSNLDIVHDWGDRLEQNYFFGQLFVDDNPYVHPRPDEFSFMFGLELSLLRLLHFRWGYLHDEYLPGNNDTHGVGIGGSFKRFYARFDWASIPQRMIHYDVSWSTQPLMGDDDNVDRFGFTLGMKL